MSRLIDKLNQVSQLAPQPMGFRAAQAGVQKPAIVLIASLAQVDVGDLTDYVAGADAGLMPISSLTSGAKAIKKTCQAASDIPWGGSLGNISSKGIKQLENSGCDFVVFPPASTSSVTLEDSKVGRILQVEASLDECLLRAVDELPVDAVLISPEKGQHFITWHRLMVFHHFADSLSKPLLAYVPANVAPRELQAVWEAGISGVVLEAGELKGRLKEMRQSFDKLTFRPQRKRGKGEALLPHMGGEMGEEEEED